jgi:hypothetical protein
MPGLLEHHRYQGAQGIKFAPVFVFRLYGSHGLFKLPAVAGWRINTKRDSICADQPMSIAMAV